MKTIAITSAVLIFAAMHMVRAQAHPIDEIYVSAALSATYSHSSRLALSGNLQCSHTRINTPDRHLRHNSLTGSLVLQWFMGDFSISPWVEFGKTTLNRSSLMLLRSPISYNLQVTYSHGNLYAAIVAASPFSSNKSISRLSTTAYAHETISTPRASSRVYYVTLSYTFDFGRRIKKIQKDHDQSPDSSLLQVAT